MSTTKQAGRAMARDGSVLAIDTTFAACSAAVLVRQAGRSERVFACCEPMASGHAERLMPMIRTVMRDADVNFDDLSSIAVTVGPGTFTGTRVGVAAARGLALATGLPVLATTSLALIAAMAKGRVATPSGDALLMVCVDARRDQVYRQDFSFHSPVAKSPAVIMGVEDAARDAASRERVVVVGNAAQTVSEAAAGLGKAAVESLAVGWPSAEYLFETDLETCEDLRPLYLRAPDAKPQTDKKIARLDHRA